MKSHNLKTIPPYWEDVASGRKTFELRLNDRDFQVGDALNLQEYLPDKKTYTGRVCYAHIVYILEGFSGLQSPFAILGIELTDLMSQTLSQISQEINLGQVE